MTNDDLGLVGMIRDYWDDYNHGQKSWDSCTV